MTKTHPHRSHNSSTSRRTRRAYEGITEAYVRDISRLSARRRADDHADLSGSGRVPELQQVGAR